MTYSSVLRLLLKCQEAVYCILNLSHASCMKKCTQVLRYLSHVVYFIDAHRGKKIWQLTFNFRAACYQAWNLKQELTKITLKWFGIRFMVNIPMVNWIKKCLSNFLIYFLKTSPSLKWNIYCMASWFEYTFSLHAFLVGMHCLNAQHKKPWKYLYNGSMQLASYKVAVTHFFKIVEFVI